jgi:hypothetical protein
MILILRRFYIPLIPLRQLLLSPTKRACIRTLTKISLNDRDEFPQHDVTTPTQPAAQLFTRAATTHDVLQHTILISTTTEPSISGPEVCEVSRCTESCK